jgi:hypothetical protein
MLRLVLAEGAVQVLVRAPGLDEKIGRTAWQISGIRCSGTKYIGHRQAPTGHNRFRI